LSSPLKPSAPFNERDLCSVESSINSLAAVLLQRVRRKRDQRCAFTFPAMMNETAFACKR